MEHTFVMVKPDGVARGLIGEVVRRFEAKGLRISAMRMLYIDQDLAARHYGMHVGKPFYVGLIDYITSGPSVAMVVSGGNAISVVRNIVGATDPAKAAPGTIRGDLAMDISRNIVHASDSADSAAREIDLFFDEADLHDHPTAAGPFLSE